MARDFRISVDLGHLIPPGSPLDATTLPNLAHAVQRVAEEAQRRWVDYAMGAPLPGGGRIQNRTGEYARSIQLRQVGNLSAEVFTVLPYALAIEEGSPSRDLKRMLGWSLKVRVSAQGKRYLIIPFRWNHPNSVLGANMPREVHNWWQGANRRPSHVTATFQRPSGTGAYDIKTRQRVMVPGWRYQWGDRLKKTDLAGMGIGGTQAKRLAGMVNFRKPGAGGGGSAHSQFLTFRVMHEDSQGWIAPAQEGKWPARTVADQIRPLAEAAFRRAVEEDVKGLLGVPPGTGGG